MISIITGNVLYFNESKAIIKTNSGLGYEIHVYFVLMVGQEVELFTSQIFRENTQELYGFKSLHERNIFEHLLNVKGVGPKSAYALIENLGAEELVQAILTEDRDRLRKAPGVGPKASSQIILDLAEKFKKHFVDLKGPSDKKMKIEGQSIDKAPLFFSDAILMCKEMGFREDEAIKISRKILSETEIKTSQELFKKIVKELAL